MPKLRSKLISEEVEDGVSKEKTCVFEGWWEQSSGLAEKFIWLFPLHIMKNPNKLLGQPHSFKGRIENTSKTEENFIQGR